MGNHQMSTGGLENFCELPTDDAPLLETFYPSSEQIQAEIQHVLEMRLSDELSGWITDYAQVGNRAPYLWNWCRRAVELTTLPCVESRRFDEICDTKVLGVMLDVLWDDVADQSDNVRFLECLLAIPFSGSHDGMGALTPAERAYAEFTRRVWAEIESRASQYPRYTEFEDLWRFDYHQLASVMRYSQLLYKRPELLNLAEHDVYTPHNMHIMICSTFDLMCSPDFNSLELGKLREVIWHAQWMGRIGNLVTTWRRELDEGDFTSGVYASAVSRGHVDIVDLIDRKLDMIEAAIQEAEDEEVFLERWQEHRRFLRSRVATFRAFDLEVLIRGLERLFCLHLGSRGQK
jgi:hypothetical protein